MGLLQDEPEIPTKRLIVIGLPSFFAAVAVSVFTHQQVHILAGPSTCTGHFGAIHSVLSATNLPETTRDCGISALAGQLWTLGLGLFSFAFFLRNPRNLFLISMAFVNATIRLPETITVFLQLLIHNKAVIRADESAALTLVTLSDPTIPTVIMCFYSILVLFFAIIVVHNIKSIRLKWLIALSLFISMGYIETGVWWLMSPGPGGS